MNKHIAITIVLFLTGLFILPMTTFGKSGVSGNYTDEITAVMATQIQLQPQAFTVSWIETLQKKLREDNEKTLKQLMANAQKKIIANLQEEIKGLNAKLTQ